MRYFKLFALGFTILLSACSGSKKISSSVSNPVSDYQSSQDYTVLYNLPRTSLQFNIETTRTVTRRGPYYQFAEKYLGISGVPVNDSEIWAISDIQIKALEEADPENYYMLVAKNVHSFAFLRLAREGFILPIHQSQITDQTDRFQTGMNEPDKLLFTDLGVKRVVFQETQTSMRLMQQDTAFVSVPVLRKEVVRKSMEEKAKEAADFIIDLRMNRFKLISGEYDLFPDGVALDAILKEYKRLEEEYLSLFIGKTFTQFSSHVFEFIPSGNSEVERTVLFRFSDNKGILPQGDLSGRPVTLEVVRENRLESLKGIMAVGLDKENQSRIHYRIPDIALVQVVDGKLIVAKSRFPVAQYGKVLTLPANFRWE
jgi:hypothetical protein